MFFHQIWNTSEINPFHILNKQASSVSDRNLLEIHKSVKKINMPTRMRFFTTARQINPEQRKKSKAYNGITIDQCKHLAKRQISWNTNLQGSQARWTVNVVKHLFIVNTSTDIQQRNSQHTMHTSTVNYDYRISIAQCKQFNCATYKYSYLLNKLRTEPHTIEPHL